jgi:hypothetical protein
MIVGAGFSQHPGVEQGRELLRPPDDLHERENSGRIGEQEPIEGRIPHHTGSEFPDERPRFGDGHGLAPHA